MCSQRFFELKVLNAQESNPLGLDGTDATRDAEHPDVRKRLVAKEFHAGRVRTDTFAGTPSLLALLLFISIAASTCRSRKPFLMLLADAQVAFLLADELGESYMQPPLSVCASDRCSKLCKSMYGIRRASRNWQNKIAEVAESHGYRRLVSCHCTMDCKSTCWFMEPTFTL